VDGKKEQAANKQINIDYGTAPVIIFTDYVFGNTNEDGFVFDICQKIGPTNQMRVVSRIGMSREFARKFLADMGRLLAMSEGQLQTGKKGHN
jgi:hypothetical protein